MSDTKKQTEALEALPPEDESAYEPPNEAVLKAIRIFQKPRD